MKQSSKEINSLKKSIKENVFTIYSGIHTINKDEIIFNLIDEIKKEKECVVLDFSILNWNRKYESTENIKILKNLIKPNEETIIFIIEFTNCEEWIKIIDFIIKKYNYVKIFCSTSFNFSSTVSFSRNFSFKYLFKEIKYIPATMEEYFEECPNSNLTNYIENGTLIYKDKNMNKEKLKLVSNLNFSRLFNIFLVLTKVRNHFYIEIFFKFLLENLDKKLTIDFIKKNISNSTKMKIKNSKIFWKYINLLLDLYILVPVNTISTNSKSLRIQSKFVCVDHMLFGAIKDLKNKYFLIGRNIFINEFLKRDLKVFTVEKDGEEIGISATLFNGKKIIISYSPTYDEEILKTIIGAQKDDYNLIHFKRNATQKELLEIIEKGLKNPK